jgi:peptidoglycan hydrolase CwlO-like protein
MTMDRWARNRLESTITDGVTELLDTIDTRDEEIAKLEEEKGELEGRVKELEGQVEDLDKQVAELQAAPAEDPPKAEAP